MSLIRSRGRINKRDCFIQFPSFVDASDHSPSSMWCFFSLSRFEKSLGSGLRPSHFASVFPSRKSMGPSSYWPKTPDWRNRFAPEYVQTMTYCSSLNSSSIVTVGLLFGFWAQDHSNGVFKSIVRRREDRLWYMANQTDSISRPIVQRRLRSNKGHLQTRFESSDIFPPTHKSSSNHTICIVHVEDLWPLACQNGY